MAQNLRILQESIWDSLPYSTKLIVLESSTGQMLSTSHSQSFFPLTMSDAECNSLTLAESTSSEDVVAGFSAEGSNLDCHDERAMAFHS